MSMSCTKTAKAITLPCPMCGDVDAAIQIQLWCLDAEGEQFRCNGCETEFGREQIEAIIKRWTKILTWLDAVPDMEGE